MFPGNLESKGVFANKTNNIPKLIRMQPVINKGVSIFIIEYTFQDEVVNGNVPHHLTQFLTRRIQRNNKIAQIITRFFKPRNTRNTRNPTAPILFCVKKNMRREMSLQVHLHANLARWGMTGRRVRNDNFNSILLKHWSTPPTQYAGG